MIRIDCPPCSQAPRPDPACPLCGGLGWFLRVGIVDGSRGLRLETLREAEASWARIVRAVSPSTASAARALDCSAPTLAKMLGGPAALPTVETPVEVPPPAVAPVEAPVPVQAPEPPAVDPAPVDPTPVVPVIEPEPPVAVATDRGPAGCVPGCVSLPGHKGWHVGPDGRSWRARRLS